MFVDEKREGEQALALEPWRRICLAAADILERDGWCQRRYHHPDGQHCVIGAISKACDNAIVFGKCQPLDLNGLRATEHLINTIWGAGYPKHLLASSCLPNWNDKAGRTQEEVVSVLRETARA